MERSIINTRQPHTTINCMFPCVTSTIALRDYRMAHSSKRAMSIIKAITQPSTRVSTKGKWNVKFDSRRLSTIIHWVSIIDFWTRSSISLFLHPAASRVKYGDDLHHISSLDDKYASPINCHIAHVVDDTSHHVLKSSPNPTLSQLQTANQIELDDGTSVIKSEDTNFAMPYSI